MNLTRFRFVGSVRSPGTSLALHTRCFDVWARTHSFMKGARTMSRTKILVLAAIVASLFGGSHVAAQTVAPTGGSSFTRASDPGVRCGDLGAGGMITGLTPDQITFFND